MEVDFGTKGWCFFEDINFFIECYYIPNSSPRKHFQIILQTH